MFDTTQRNKVKLIVFFVTTVLVLSGAPLRFSGSAGAVNRPAESSSQSGHSKKFATQSKIESYDLLLQDDSSGSILRWNSDTGDYVYGSCSDGFMLTGAGSAESHGETFTLTDESGDRRVSATLDNAARTGYASIQYPLGSPTQTITDRDTTNDPGEKDTEPPEVGVTAPNGGEIIDTQSIFGITWESSDNVGVTSHDVFYSTDGGVTYSTIVTGLSGDANQYDWFVPLMIDTRTVRVRVVVRDGACNATRDESDVDFIVWNPPASFTHLAEAPLFMSGQGLTSSVYMTNTSANALVVELDPHQPVGNATQNLPYQVLLNPGASATVDVASLYTIGTDPENSHFPDMIQGGIRLRHNGTRDNDVRAVLVAERDCTEEFTTPFTYATSSLSATGTMQCSPMYYVDASTDVLVSFQNVTDVAQTVQLACHYGTGAYGTPNGVFNNQPIVLGPQKTHIINLRSVWSAFGGAEWGSMTVFTSNPQSVVCHSVMRSGDGMSWDCPFVDPNMCVKTTKVAQTVRLDYNSSENAYMMVCNMSTTSQTVTAEFHTNTGPSITPVQVTLDPGAQKMITLDARQLLSPGGSAAADVRLKYSGLPSDILAAGCSMTGGQDRAMAMKFKEASAPDGRRLSSPYFRFDEDISGQILISNLGKNPVKAGARMVFANSSARPLKTSTITIPSNGFGVIDLSSVGDALAEGVIATGRVDLIHNGADGIVTAAVVETGCYNSSQVVPLDGAVPLDPLTMFPLSAGVVIPGGCVEADAITDGTVTNPTFTNPGGCYGTFIGTVQTATNTFTVTFCVPTNCVGEQSLVYTPPGGEAEETDFTVVQTSLADFSSSLGKRINPNGTTQFTLTANSPFPNSLLQVEFAGKGGSVFTPPVNGNGTSASITGTGPMNHVFLGNVKKIFVRQLNPDGSVNESVPLVLKAKNTGAYFALDKPLSVTDVTPNNVPVTGGTVTITGSGFQTWTLGEGSNSVTVYPVVLIGKNARHDQIPFSLITVTVPNAIKGDVGPTPREIGTCAEIGQTPCKTITVINPGGSDGVDDLTPGAPLLTINAPPPPVIDRIVSLTVAGAEGPAASNSIGMQNIRTPGAYTAASPVYARVSGRNFDRVRSITFVGAAPTSIGPSSINLTGTIIEVGVPAFCLSGASNSVAVTLDDGVNPIVSFANGWSYSATGPLQVFLPNVPLGAVAFLTGPCEDIGVTYSLYPDGGAAVDCLFQVESCVGVSHVNVIQHGIESTVFPNANISLLRWRADCSSCFGTHPFHYAFPATATNARSGSSLDLCVADGCNP